MTDKVQLIKEEIERRINNLKGYVLQKGSDQRWVTAIDQLTWIKAFIDSLPEEHNEDLGLEEELDRRFGKTNNYSIGDFAKLYSRKDFKNGAEWQKQKDQETIELAEDHAMLAGMMKEREEMMENAVDAFVHQGLYSKYVTECDDEALANALKNYNSGDKVKVLILKTEQQ